MNTELLFEIRYSTFILQQKQLALIIISFTVKDDHIIQTIEGQHFLL